MNIDLWKNFVSTGSVADYLKYRQSEQEEAELNNANNNQGISNQRTDNGGE